MISMAGVVVAVAGLWLLGLAVAVVVVPDRAERFLSGFASSPLTHYSEQSLRLIAGAAFIAYAPEMRFPELFRIFGWVVAVTAIGLLLIPWTWHQRFGEWAIPLALRHMKLLALGSFALGCFVLYGVLAGLF